MNRIVGVIIIVVSYVFCSGGIELGSVVYAQGNGKPRPVVGVPIVMPTVAAQPEITIELLVDKSATESVYELLYAGTILPVTSDFLNQCETYLVSLAAFAQQSAQNQELVVSPIFKKITWDIT